MPKPHLIILHVFVDGFDLLHNLMMQIITIILKVVGRRIAIPAWCPHPNPKPVNMLCFMSRRIKVVDRIEVANELTLKWGNYLEYPDGLHTITGFLNGRDRKVSVGDII